ncbi:hypothetical protein NDU88_000439, partial [Pleurodeles waltl]
VPQQGLTSPISEPVCSQVSLPRNRLAQSQILCTLTGVPPQALTSPTSDPVCS